MRTTEELDWLLGQPVTVRLVYDESLLVEHMQKNGSSTQEGSRPNSINPIIFLGKIVKLDSSIIKLCGTNIDLSVSEFRHLIEVSIMADTERYAVFASRMQQYQVDPDTNMWQMTIDLPNQVTIFDNRELRRAGLDVDADITPLSFRGKYLSDYLRHTTKARVIDISTTGARLETNLAVRMNLRLNLDFILCGREINVSGDVVWVEKIQDKYQCGLEFINMDQHTAKVIEDWVRFS